MAQRRGGEGGGDPRTESSKRVGVRAICDRQPSSAPKGSTPQGEAASGFAAIVHARSGASGLARAR